MGRKVDYFCGIFCYIDSYFGFCICGKSFYDGRWVEGKYEKLCYVRMVVNIVKSFVKMISFFICLVKLSVLLIFFCIIFLFRVFWSLNVKIIVGILRGKKKIIVMILSICKILIFFCVKGFWCFIFFYFLGMFW